MSMQFNVVGQAVQIRVNPVARLRLLYDQGADIDTLLKAMNETHAVVKYGNQTLIASVDRDDISLMDEPHFHRMFANLNLFSLQAIDKALRELQARIERIGTGITSLTFENFREAFADVVIAPQTRNLSKLWFSWHGRRQYLGRGVVFEPGGPLEIPGDMLNLWRGFGIEPKQGDWSLMQSHIFNVVCSGNRQHYDYLIKWMAYAVQHLDKPIGVAVAFRGAQGAGKGIVARTFGKFFGKHFAHIANGDQLTGRFNASLATSCAVFLDEALWAGDRQGEGVLKALITEPRLQLEAKFRDPIMVENRLRIMVASNNDWIVPAGVGDRRWFILDVADTYAGTGHREYWDALYSHVENGGAAAMFHDLRTMDLRGFDVRAVPHTIAKAQQQALSLRGTEAWLYHVLQEGEIGGFPWQKDGLLILKSNAYDCYVEFSRQQHAWRPEINAQWSKKIRKVLRSYIGDTRPKEGRSFQLAPLADCRRQFEIFIGAPFDWEPVREAPNVAAVLYTAEDVGESIELDALLNGTRALKRNDN